MLTNFFTITLRQLRRQKMYAAIKIGGFALSIAACLLISLYIRNELSYDRSWSDAGRIYRIVGHEQDRGVLEKWTAFPAPMTASIKKDFPEVERCGRIMYNQLFPGAGANAVKAAGKTENTYEEGFTYADQDMLSMLQMPVVYGTLDHALGEPHTVVLTQSKAGKLFPGENPIGKTVELNNDLQPWRITAVVRDMPVTTHLPFSYFLSLSGVEWWHGEQGDWDANNYMNYVELRPGADVSAFEKKLTADIRDNYYLPVMTKEGDKNAKQELSSFELHLQPIGDIHLHSNDIRDNFLHGDIRFVWLFGAIAAFILVIACINFVNLSTAKAANRAKEVGLRKVIGAGRGELIRQFLAESTLYSFLSFVVGLTLAWAALPYFNRLADRSLSIPWTSAWLLPVMVLSAVFVGLAAGLYPAFYLSAFQPARVLKGELSRGSKGGLLRNTLVVFQFATSIILIIGTVVIYGQTHFILNMPLGYDKDEVVLLHGTNTIGDRIGELKKELLQLPVVKSVSISDFLPVAKTKRNGNEFWQAGKMNDVQGVDAQAWTVDSSYFGTMGMQLIAGRNFLPADSQAVIINQTMAADLQLKDPIGARIVNNSNYPLTVVGVLRDFNFESVRGKVGGLVLRQGISPSIVAVKLKTADMAGSLAAINLVWRRFAPEQPLRATFLDEDFATMYADVRRMAGIFTSFALLAISIACLGLFALSAFMAEQRSKEIGIRKVLGASVAGITALMSKDFLRLVVLAFLIAAPLAWWGMTLWLRDFAYRIPIGWWVFALAGGCALIIAVVTVSFQSIRSALANPVTSLRSE